MANDAAALELIEKLGLTGQQKIMNRETVTRVPYRVMEEQEFHVYKALCPRACKIEDYELDPIPVRVLQVAAHAKALDFFKRIEIWCPNPAVFKDDPLLVGIESRKNEHGWANDHFYLLARWGRVLRPFEELIPLATEAMRKMRLGKLREIVSECEAAIRTAGVTHDLKVLSHQPSSYVSP